jgi:hypothetical protein
MATIYTDGVKVKHADEIKSFVIISKTAQGKEFVWGETTNTKTVERMKSGHHWAFPEGTLPEGKFLRIEEFENRKAAWASKYGERLEVLYGRNSRPR